MADIDLKTETPDTSLPTTGFLFGADSQAASAPSVYSTQTVATTLLGSTSLTGATITTSQPVLDLAQTWNASGVTFTGLKFNVTDTASAAGSLLMDLQVGGSSKFNIDKNGNLFNTAIRPTGSYLANNFKLTFFQESGAYAGTSIGANGVDVASIMAVGWTSGSSTAARDLILTRRAAANLRLGAADTTGTTAPTAQTLSVQSWASSTNNNQPGADFRIDGSQGTGTGAGGSIIFRVAPAGAVANGVQNALATFLEATSARAFNLYNTTDVTTNFERGKIAWESNVLRIGTEKGGTGTARALEFQTDGTTRLTISATANAITLPSGSTLNCGDSGVVRLRYINSPSNLITFFDFYNTSGFATFAAGATNPRINFGGTTSSFPALKRDSASLIVRLADDSADAGLQCAALTVTGNLTISTKDIVTDTTTGTKIGTSTSQKIGFYDKAPVVQPTAVADATDAATVITQLNALLSRMRDLGLIAT